MLGGGIEEDLFDFFGISKQFNENDVIRKAMRNNANDGILAVSTGGGFCPSTVSC